VEEEYAEVDSKVLVMNTKRYVFPSFLLFFVLSLIGKISKVREICV
jgi:hypothetical protein